MKILLATDTYFPHVNGTAIFIHRLARTLAGRKHQVYVIAPSQTLGNTVTVDDAGVTVYGLHSMPIPNYPKFRLSLPLFSKKTVRKILTEINPDIVHLQQHFIIGKAVFNVARELNIPIIGTNHFLPDNLTPFAHLPKPIEEKIAKYGWGQFVKIFNEIEIITTPTASAAKIIKNVGLNKNVIPVSNGIDLKTFKPRNNKGFLKKTFRVPNRKILLAVGRLDKEKQLDLVLGAMPQVLEKCDIQLIITGVGSLGNKLKALAQDLKITDHVTFTGFVNDEDLPFVYNCADVFVIAGLAELQSLATMEAMASGLPVIAADARALPELVHNGKNGYLFKSDDKNMLAKHIIKLMQDDKLRKKMGQASLEMIKQHDQDKTIEKYETLYHRLLSAHPTS